jgi:hypothetical protein
MSVVTDYYGDWRERTFTCTDCGWKGLGAKCTRGELYRELFDICCPACQKEVGSVMFPTVEEARQNWGKLSAWDQHAIESIEGFRKDFAGRKLVSPEQLPDIEGGELIFVWDIETQQKGGDTLIRCGSEILWREPAYWECYKRFAEVAAILKQKYGGRVRDLVPTVASYLYLYGDRMSASDEVDEVRKALLRS